MMAKPIFCVTHPRACSTAFERVFMTRTDLVCFHEPFGDAFYYGPERMSIRFEDDEPTRTESGFGNSTFKTIFDRLEDEEAEVRSLYSLSFLSVSAFGGVSTNPSGGLNFYGITQLQQPINFSNSTPAASGKKIAGNAATYLVQGKRLFIKDMIFYLIPPDGQAAKITPSLGLKKRGIGTHADDVNSVNGVNGTNGSNSVNGVSDGVKKAPFPFDTEDEPGNPTIVPQAMLDKFHFTFLIRDPHSSIPSYYRCTVPPLDDITGFHEFYPSEAGYNEVRRFFEYTRRTGQVGPKQAGPVNGHMNGNEVNGVNKNAEICVVDADDLLDDPAGIIEAYCNSVGLEYYPEMLNWDNDEDQNKAKEAFAKWRGFHEDAIDSTDLKPRAHKKAPKSEEKWDAEWKEKYGEEAAKMIRKTVDDNMQDYLYLKQFSLTA